MYRECRSLLRGLEILHAMNQTGATAIPALSAHTGLHRTTVQRLLETLRTAGYVERSPAGDGYRLTMRVRALSEGFTDQLWVSEIAGPVLSALFDEVVWPTDLYVLDGDCMLCRETTHRISPMSVHRSMVGQRWPVMAGAAGRAYLAFSPEHERQALISVLARSDLAQNGVARDDNAVSALIRRTVRRGYAESVGELEQKMSAIALPIRAGERVLGCVSLVFFSSAMTPAEAARRHLRSLEKAVQTIEAVAAQRLGQPAP
jgi:IclR family mhp operon transcriptional activator